MARREPASTYRRRRLAAVAILLALGVGAALLLRAALGDGGDGGEPAPDPLAGVSLEDLVGQRLMVRMTGSATGELLDLARSGAIGGVIAFPPPDSAPADLLGEVERLQRAAAEGGNPPLLVAIDQEGGPVKRLPDGPPNRSPAQLGAAGDAEAAAAEGAETGRYLAQFGINADLAPVLDVPAPGSFVADRAFGADPDTVSELGVAFATGLAQGGVAAAAKHFPGLGNASANTDLEPSLVDASRRQLEIGLEPFEAAVGAGVEMVMTSNATYTALDPDVPASVSERIIQEELRGRLGFDGVVITDDLLAGAIGAALSPRDAAVEAARAGADVLLFARATDPAQVGRALLQAAKSGTLDRAALEQSYLRIAALKNGLE